MHKRRSVSSGAIEPTIENGLSGAPYSPAVAFGSPDPGYASPRQYATHTPQYTTPNGKSNHVPQKLSKSRKKSWCSCRLPQWMYLILICVLSYFTLVDQFHLWEVSKKLPFNKKMSLFDRQQGELEQNLSAYEKLQEDLKAMTRNYHLEKASSAVLKEENADLDKHKWELIRQLEDKNQENLDASATQKLEEYARIEIELTQAKNQISENFDIVSSQLTDVRKEVQLISRREVQEKYGIGPYKIEMQLDFANESMDQFHQNIIVIELAPLDLMPASIYHFLEMIRWKLWDGCAFHRNAGHVVQAGPVPPYADSTNTPSRPNPRRAFDEHQLLSVPFQEYSHEFPHVKYTIGYAGRPGGPDWYFNAVDNTKNHGPGGQTAYKVVNEADPCFGKVVQGFEVVDKLLQQPVKPGGFRAMEQNVGIVYMKLIT